VAVYFPTFEQVAVYRSRHSPDEYVTIVAKGPAHPFSWVEINDEHYDYDEAGTEKTRMFMRVAEQRRADEAEPE
jgi:hypothetical protein